MEITSVNSLWIAAGYAAPAAYLASGLIITSRPLRALAAGTAVFAGMCVFFRFSAAWRFYAGPAAVWFLSVMFMSAWRREIRAMERAMDASAAKLESERAPLENELSAMSAVCADLSVELEKRAGTFAAVKETLSCMDKIDLSRRAVEILARIPGVRNAAVYDGTMKLLAGERDDSLLLAAVSAAHGAGYEVAPALWGDRKFGTLAAAFASGTSAGDRAAASEILWLFAIGYVRAALFEEYKSKSRRDALTGIFNRRYFLKKLDIEISRAARYGSTFALLMLDADHFKTINDTCGHAAGDAVLIKLVSILEEFDYPGAFAGRYGGEEFVICLPLCSRADAASHARRLRATVAATDFHDEKNNMLQSVVRVSVGGAVYPEDGASSAEIIAAADSMLYVAKSAGRNRVRIKGMETEE